VGGWIVEGWCGWGIGFCDEESWNPDFALERIFFILHMENGRLGERGKGRIMRMGDLIKLNL
jgi:hypothetical protein